MGIILVLMPCKRRGGDKRCNVQKTQPIPIRSKAQLSRKRCPNRKGNRAQSERAPETGIYQHDVSNETELKLLQSVMGSSERMAAMCAWIYGLVGVDREELVRNLHTYVVYEVDV